MSFKKVDSKPDFVKMEHHLLEWWEKKGIVKKYLQKNVDSKKKFLFCFPFNVFSFEGSKVYSISFISFINICSLLSWDRFLWEAYEIVFPRISIKRVSKNNWSFMSKLRFEMGKYFQSYMSLQSKKHNTAYSIYHFLVDLQNVIDIVFRYFVNMKTSMTGVSTYQIGRSWNIFRIYGVKPCRNIPMSMIEDCLFLMDAESNHVI